MGGPLCESGDIFTQEEGGFVCTRDLPPAELGDLLVIECAGAYGYVMSSNYNSKPMAAEVLIQDGAAHLVRRRQTFEDLIQGELIPGRASVLVVASIRQPVVDEAKSPAEASKSRMKEAGKSRTKGKDS